MTSLSSGAKVPRMTDEKRPHLSVVTDDTVDPALKVKKSPRYTQTIGNSVVPYGYEIWQDGIYAVTAPANPDESEDFVDYYEPSLAVPLPLIARKYRKKVCSSCVWIGDFGYSVDTKEHLLLLCYIAPQGTLHQEWVTRDLVAARRSMVPLSNLGLPANETNATELIIYLAAFEHANRSREGFHVGTRVGWHETRNGQGWLLGARWYGPDELKPDPRGQGLLARGLKVSGTLRDWIHMAREVDKSGPIARLTLGAVFAAPLLRHVGHRTFFWYLQGRSRFGKTALEKFAMSAWGDPRALKLTFNTSQIGIAEVLGLYTDLPLFVDERQAAGEKFDFGKFIYDISLESGRVRAKRTGGTQERPKDWKTIVLASGEEGFVSTADRGGQRNRVVELDISGLSLSVSGRYLHDFSEICYGHAGPKLLETLVNVVNSIDNAMRMRERCRALVEMMSSEFPDMGEAPANIAVTAFGRWLADRWVFEDDADEAWERCMNDARAVIRHLRPSMPDSLAERGLEVLRSYVCANPSVLIDGALFGKLPFQRNLLGFRVEEGTLFNSEESARILVKAGINPVQFWKALKDEGRLICTSADLNSTAASDKRYDRLTTRRRIGGPNGMRMRGYLVSRAPEDVAEEQESVEAATLRAAALLTEQLSEPAVGEEALPEPLAALLTFDDAPQKEDELPISFD